jgi:hypothetical protein
MVVTIKWKNNLKRIFKWKFFLVAIPSIQWITFMGQNNHMLIIGIIIIEIILITINNILV